MKNFFKDFKEFISRGNIIDLAIGVIIGAAFSAIVTSLVNDIIMPPINLLTGGGIEDLSVVINGVDKYIYEAVADANGVIQVVRSINPEATLIYYGKFIQAILNFIIIALCLFIGLKIVMSAKKSAEKHKQVEEAPAEETPAAPPAPTEAELLSEIRDLLKAQQSTTKE